MIGYCPQFDALSDLLTCKEHLVLYSRIKGIPGDKINAFAEIKLEEMDLLEYKDFKAGTLSGGNKRKLSVAIACIGNPPVVFLDEPSAGMDPEARKKMWKVIDSIKKRNTSLILTTHSMEEAEAVCDRIGIMVAGRFRCLGTSTQIKTKFGKTFELEVKVKPRTHEQVQEQVAKIQNLIEEGEYIRMNRLETACNALGGAEIYS
jgi:ABC-type multidrug transport system ATPase subunit